VTTLARWWGQLPEAGLDGGTLVALDFTQAAGGPVSETFWAPIGYGPPASSYASPGSALLLAEAGAMTPVSVPVPPGSSPLTVNLTRSRARLMNPGAFAVTPFAVSADGHFLVYTTFSSDAATYHAFGWDSNREQLFDLSAGVGALAAGEPPVGYVQGAVSPDGTRAAFCAAEDASSSSLFVFTESSETSQRVSDFASCFGSALLFSADAERLAYFAATASDAGSTLHVWDAQLGTSTAIPGATEALPIAFVGGGKYLFYFVNATIPVGSMAFPLWVYDVDAQSAQSLGVARWVSPSADGHSVAYVSSGQVMVWTDSAAAATPIDSMRTDGNGALPMTPSHDGNKVLYQDATLSLRVFVFGHTASTLVASSATCSPISNAVPTGVWGAFSDDSSTVGAVAPIASSCNQGNFTEAVHLFDIASSTDHVFSMPSTMDSDTGEVLDVSAGAVEYAYSGPGGYFAHVWSPTLGDVDMSVDPGNSAAPLYAALSRDGNRGAFVPDTSSPEFLQLWDREAGTATIASFADNAGVPFVGLLDRTTGIAVGYDSTKGFLVDRQGLTATPWALGPGAPLLSASDKTFVASGASGTDTGLFALSFLSGNQTFLEGGKVVGATDTHVYFIAADGLCEIGVP